MFGVKNNALLIISVAQGVESDCTRWQNKPGTLSMNPAFRPHGVQGPWYKVPPCAILPRRREKLARSGVLLPTRQRNKAYWQKTKPRRQEMMPPMRIWLPTRPNPNTGFFTWSQIPASLPSGAHGLRLVLPTCEIAAGAPIVPARHKTSTMQDSLRTTY